MRILVFLLIVSQSLFSQELTLVNKSALKADQFIGFDSYKHIYFVKSGAIYKEGELGKFVFQDFQLGTVTSVDIINPLNVVVFYAEANTVVFLDNRLNEKERINFNDLPSFLNISAATNAGNNRLWIFNTDTQQLELFHYRNLQQTVVSQPFTGKLATQISDFNTCTILTDSHLREINIYGSLLSEQSLENYSSIVRTKGKMVIVKDNELYFLKDNTIHPLSFTFNENPIKDLQLTQEFLYIYDSKILYTFTLTQPKQ